MSLALSAVGRISDLSFERDSKYAAFFIDGLETPPAQMTGWKPVLHHAPARACALRTLLLHAGTDLFVLSPIRRNRANCVPRPTRVFPSIPRYYLLFPQYPCRISRVSAVSRNRDSADTLFSRRKRGFFSGLFPDRFRVLRIFSFTRSHALRGKHFLDAPRRRRFARCCPFLSRKGRGASRIAFPRGARKRILGIQKSLPGDIAHHPPSGSSGYLKKASSSSDTFHIQNEHQHITRGVQKLVKKSSDS
jgi:hypothetical protein